MSPATKGLSAFVALLSLFFSYFYSYLLLQKVGGTDLMWFLFWMLIPVGFISVILSKLIELSDK